MSKLGITQFSFVAQRIYENVLSVDGIKDDILCLKAIIRRCDTGTNRLRSVINTAMAEHLNEETANRLPIRLTLDRNNRKSNLFADYGPTVSARTLHIDHFEQMFGFQCPQATPSESTSRPKWAPTLCSVLGHELVEAAHIFATSATDACAMWRSHLIGTIAENRMNGADKDAKVACRSVDPHGVAVFAHGKHADSITQYDTNYMIIHGGAPGISAVDYVTGDENTCLPRQRDWQTLKKTIIYPGNNQACVSQQ